LSNSGPRTVTHGDCLIYCGLYQLRALPIARQSLMVNRL